MPSTMVWRTDIARKAKLLTSRWLHAIIRTALRNGLHWHRLV